MRGGIKQAQFEVVQWFAMMYGVAQAMPAAERAELEEWERRNIDGGRVATSDWPGWEKYIGPFPRRGEPPKPARKQPILPEIRWMVWERDNFACLHCGARRQLTVDHIIPEVLGGTLDLDNLQTLCGPCNSRKGARA